MLRLSKKEVEDLLLRKYGERIKELPANSMAYDSCRSEWPFLDTGGAEYLLEACGMSLEPRSHPREDRRQ